MRQVGGSATGLTRAGELIALSCGVFAIYLVYGYTQEYIFQAGLRPFGWFVTLLQFACYSVIGRVELWARQEKRSSVPLRTYMQIAVLTVATMGFSNASLSYLNYPTQVIFKSCKLIPVMLGGMVIQNKSYGLLDFLASTLLCLGLIVFTLTDAKVGAAYSPTGLVFITLALAADAMIGNVQEKAMKAHGSSKVEMIFFSYSIGFCYILAICLVSGELFAALQFLYENPALQALGRVLLFSVTGYFGVNVVLTLVQSFGALTAVTVTNVRKVFTIVLSWLVFPKPFDIQYVYGGVLVLAGIALSVYVKSRPPPRLQRPPAATQVV